MKLEQHGAMLRRHRAERVENLKAAIILAEGKPKKAAELIGVHRQNFVYMFQHAIGMSAKRFMESRDG